MGWFKWAGHDSRDFGMQVEHIPGIPTPSRTLNSFDVPGHNGTLHYDTGGFENVTVEYECWFRAYDRRRIVPELGRKINGWLLGSGFGYQPLQDSYSPGFVRMAVPASGAGEITNRFMLHGRCTVAFDCKPQLFLLDGLRPMTISSGAALSNRYPFEALPVIEVTGTGTGALTVGNLQVELTGMSGTLTIDCERGNAYNADNVTVILDGGAFPSLPPGDTEISWSGGITAVRITPRWWTI